MSDRCEVLKQLVCESHYVIEPQAIAEAIVLRMMTRWVVPDVTFRGSRTVAAGPPAGPCDA